ncbi:ATP-dependent DNA helicase RecG [Hominifimenecus sp. rT4P-3]|uniref:ATP-dependent DNA helicase RecG n=1 Tax=Hominifimenecus sp. rT4P-3 TaxID=3242979 RepID=UPI003DA4D18A
MRETDSVSKCKGVGAKTAEAFGRLGIETVGDLLRHYPARYDAFAPAAPIGEAEEGKIVTVKGVFLTAPQANRFGRLSTLSVTIGDESGRVKAVWFHQPYLKNTLRKGEQRVLRGRLVRNRFGLTLEQPQIYKPEDYETMEHTLRPVYGTAAGLSGKVIGKAVAQILDEADLEKEYLPSEVRSRYGLAEWNYAIRTIHFPPDRQELLFARERLVFDEFFLFILAIRRLKEKKEEISNPFSFEKNGWSEAIVKGLPYELTNAQKRVWGEIGQDLRGKRLMNRLIQGDVGSGKTILALLALTDAAENGYQGALMAPTEVLARQHMESFTEIYETYQIPCRPILLTGSMTAAEKRKAYAAIANHEVDLVIGTHALIQEKVVYDKLALVVTDEQHRFGVHQRETFSQKGGTPHILVMSATPIPRTLAIILYGDLDISVVDELPKSRLPIKNCVVDVSYRPKAYRFLQKEIEDGRQAYVICPMVEESEGLDAENVIDYTEKLRAALPPAIHVDYLHGKMKAKEKNERMEQFLRGEIQVLVSTTVVEVGVNVPNATVMMVENAERFGLAQLHQLRGRVGRGSYQSYCIFVDGSGEGENNARLKILRDSNDGFRIASEDLKLRGPGDVFGVRQSGNLEFALGDIFTDSRILQAASDTAEEILEQDPELTFSEHRPLSERLDRYRKESFDRLYL